MQNIYTSTVPEIEHEGLGLEADGLRLSFAKKLIAVSLEIETELWEKDRDIESEEFRVLSHINDRLCEMLSSFTGWGEQNFIAREIDAQ